jgi:hypothetical protein
MQKNNFSVEVRLGERDKKVVEDIITKFCVLEWLAYFNQKMAVTLITERYKILPRGLQSIRVRPLLWRIAYVYSLHS